MPRKKVTIHEVGEPVERPYAEAVRSDEEHAAAEDRQGDQIADYHQEHPTLENDVPDALDEPE